VVDLRAELTKAVEPRRVLTRAIDRLAYANDASVYRLVPRAVVRPRTIDEVRGLFRFSQTQRIPVVFRAAGSSLSGQSITDGVLVDISRFWKGLEVLEDGDRVRVQPGVIGGDVNRHLARHGAKIGPDPASINTCMMGGILANNSSGMCCGVVDNAYHTLESIVFVLPNGVVVDSAAEDADERLAAEAPAVVRGLMKLRERVVGDEALRRRIRARYRMKNTMGYSINAFVDFERPVEILSHLMIGSEGTLGFIADAVLRTVPDYPIKYTGLLFFHDVPRACAAIAPLRDSGARALELMDRASLRSIEDQPGVPSRIRDLPGRAAALLVEYQCSSEGELEDHRRACDETLPRLPLAADPDFTLDPGRQAALWRVRKGLIPSVGAFRARGTSFIIEDVVFPVEELAEGVGGLQDLFVEHDYDDAIVFGHAKDGNLHFVLIQAFESAPDVERYDAFMNDLAGLVVGRHGGALKAEHGTGRNMAPFVETEWGSEAFEIMRDVKRLIDPDDLLNPGVIINDDPRAHVTDLKDLPTIEPEVDQCIECGFCESECPSRELTLTPRQRIVVRRAMARIRRDDPGSPVLREIEADYVYDGVETCAADGMCATACPVAIDTGTLVKRLRCDSRSTAAHEMAVIAANRFGLVETAARATLRAARFSRAVLGNRSTVGLSRIAGALLGTPQLNDDLPGPAGPLPSGATRDDAGAVYFPSCVVRVAETARENPLPHALVDVSRRAGVELYLPEGVRGTCCGMAFSSRGYRRAYADAVNHAVESLWTWSDHGRLPVVVDTSPCAHTLKQVRPDLAETNRNRFDELRILDGIEFAHDHLLPRLEAVAPRSAVALHPVCSVVKMNLVEKLRAVARHVADPEIPIAAGCCGFAGDRGFAVPELTAAATRYEAIEVRSRSYAGYYSSSRTCEIGLTRATDKPYRSFWHLLDEATRGPSPFSE
jgi:D-lactate dehydrogenase